MARSFGRPASRKCAAALFAVAAVVLLVIDRLTKIWAVDTLSQGGSDLIPGVVGFTLVYNKGASFGMLEGMRWIFVAISAVICAVIIVYLIKYRKHPAFEAATLGAILAGALGNAIDRIAFGYVVDFIKVEFIDFPVFNVADICITVGILIWILFIFFHPLSPFSSKSVEETSDDGK